MAAASRYRRRRATSASATPATRSPPGEPPGPRVAEHPPLREGGRVQTALVPSAVRLHSRPGPHGVSASQKLTQRPPALLLAQRPDTQSVLVVQLPPSSAASGAHTPPEPASQWNEPGQPAS